MERDEVIIEMRETLGTALMAFDRIPDELLDPEWEVQKRLTLGETVIPARYKELIGLAVAAACRCPYGILLHTEGARLHGASDAEVAEAVHYARHELGWSAAFSGLQVDFEEFRREVGRTIEFLARNRPPEP
jgi:AhpD family alkylhydroperoxidase